MYVRKDEARSGHWKACKHAIAASSMCKKGAFSFFWGRLALILTTALYTQHVSGNSITTVGAIEGGGF